MLAIKIGNSNLAFGLFRNDALVQVWRAEMRPEKTADEYAALLADWFAEKGLTLREVHDAAIVSVVPALTETIGECCRRYLRCEPFIVTVGTRSGIAIKYDDPRTLGADRLVDLVAAKAKYGTPALVLDFGSATTFNALDRAGNFIGGAIAPGLNMSAEALHRFTAKLPRVEISVPPRALATNTRDALRAGIFFGYVGLVNGLLERLSAEMAEPDLRVVATGGYAALLAPYCPRIQHVDPTLALEGLRLLYEMNR